MPESFLTFSGDRNLSLYYIYAAKADQPPVAEADAAADEQAIKYDILFDTSSIKGMFECTDLAKLLNVAGCLSRPDADAYFRAHSQHLLSRFDTPDAVDPSNFKSGQRERVLLLPASLFWHLLACLITKHHRSNATDPLFDLEAIDIKRNAIVKGTNISTSSRI